MGLPTLYFLKIVLDIMGSLQFHTNFRMSSSISTEKAAKSVGFNVHLLQEVFVWSGRQNDH